MKKTLTLVVLLSLLVSAAPKNPSKSGPSFSVDCTTLETGACDITQPIFVSGDGFSDHKDYQVVATPPGGPANATQSATFTTTNGSFTNFPANIVSGDQTGTWTIQIFNVGHNGLQREYGTEQTIDVDNPPPL